jgi:hypothetical protein
MLNPIQEPKWKSWLSGPDHARAPSAHLLFYRMHHSFDMKNSNLTASREFGPVVVGKARCDAWVRLLQTGYEELFLRLHPMCIMARTDRWTAADLVSLHQKDDT